MTIPPKTARLRKMMAPYEGARHTVVALSLQHGKAEILQAGPDAPGVAREDLIFEIGSITKVFTGILLCLLVEEGKIDPNAPLRALSEDLKDVPDWITPQSLTSHTSGLPRIHVPIWKALIKPLPEDPYAGFSRSDLLAWFRDRPAKAPPSRTRHAYSNLGVGLLGEALSMLEGKPFVDLLAERVIAPLGLTDTTCCLGASQQSRFVHPRNTRGNPVPPWTFQAMAAAGCLRSSARDLARFAGHVLKALDAPRTPLDHAIRRSAAPIAALGVPGGTEAAAQCSGWMSRRFGGTGPRILHHTGGTAGSASALYICPDTAAALIILSNNGVAANPWASLKLDWSNPLRQAHRVLTAT